MKFLRRRERTSTRADEHALDELERLSQEARALAQQLTSVAVRLRLETERTKT